MKGYLYLLACIVSFFILGCNQGTNKSEVTNATDAKAEANNQCFLAVHEKDTASLNITTAANGQVKGDLVIATGELNPGSIEKVLNNGQIEGRFRGDTLFVDYTYTTGTVNKTVYKNPLAFLRNREQLILGVGEIETYLGKTYFVKGKPINFEIGKYRFDSVDCKKARHGSM